GIRARKPKVAMTAKRQKSPIKSRVWTASKKLVRIAGLEPARLAALPPQSSVSANSTISATRHKLKQQKHRTQADFGRFLRRTVQAEQSPETFPSITCPNFASIPRRCCH